MAHVSIKTTWFGELRVTDMGLPLFTRATLIGTVLLALLLCTAGLPALYTRILTMRQLDSWAYYGYLVLYNGAYMLDDIVVLAIGVITISHYRLQEREGRWLKLLSGLVMAGLGAVLLLRPTWLI